MSSLALMYYFVLVLRMKSKENTLVVVRTKIKLDVTEREEHVQKYIQVL